MGEYRPAVICRRGHVYSDDATRSPAAQRCSTCGARLEDACGNCGTMIRGEYFVPGVLALTSDYAPPEFCHSCGAPFPWASRQARIWELQNLLDEEDLDEADRLTVREQLEALQNPDLDEEEQVQRWNKVTMLAPGIMQSGRRIIESVASAAVKSQLGI